MSTRLSRWALLTGLVFAVPTPGPTIAEAQVRTCLMRPTSIPVVTPLSVPSPLASSIKKQGTTWVEHAMWSFAKLSLGPRPRFADQDLPSTTEKRSFLTIATMSSAISSPILMSRSSASHASCPIMSRVSGSSVVRSMPLY